MSAIPKKKLTEEEYLAIERAAEFKSEFYDGVMVPLHRDEDPMSAIPKKKVTEEQYLAIERAAEFKSEYYDGEMFAMAGASYSHNRVKENLARHLGNALEGGSCVTLTSDMKVRSNKNRYSYPDIVVVCGTPEFADAKEDIVLNPKVIIEVLSPTTEGFDRGGKRRKYQLIDSLKEYIVVAQDQADIEHYVRGKNGKWEQSILTGLDSILIFASIKAKISFKSIYAGVEFPEQTDE